VATDLPANECPVALEDRLRPLGLTAAIKNDVLVVECTNGLRCEYSARYFVPVLFPGLEHAAISARLIELGRAEVRIGGQCYPVTSNLRMDIDLPASESPPPVSRAHQRDPSLPPAAGRRRAIRHP
jgi:hypothetical protein